MSSAGRFSSLTVETERGSVKNDNDGAPSFFSGCLFYLWLSYGKPSPDGKGCDRREQLRSGGPRSNEPGEANPGSPGELMEFMASRGCCAR